MVFTTGFLQADQLVIAPRPTNPPQALFSIRSFRAYFTAGGIPFGELTAGGKSGQRRAPRRLTAGGQGGIRRLRKVPQKAIPPVISVAGKGENVR